MNHGSPTTATSRANASPPSLAANVHAWGTARATLAEVAPLRKAIPTWAPPDTPGHFLKYADAQAVVAIAAVDRAIQQDGAALGDLSQWGVVAAPRFVGRLAGAEIFHRFAQRGEQGVSPHTLPQHSLHSVSGAISILLATHGPNVGVGGGPESLSEGLFAALTLFDLDRLPGLWLVCSEWNPEPLPDHSGQSTTDAVCHAVALALRGVACPGASGKLSLQFSNGLGVEKETAVHDVTVAELVALLADDQNLSSPRLKWRLPWGDRLDLELAAIPAVA